MPTGIFWFNNKIWEQYQFGIDWDDGEFSTIFPTHPGWDGNTGPTWWRAGRHLDTSEDADDWVKIIKGEVDMQVPNEAGDRVQGQDREGM